MTTHFDARYPNPKTSESRNEIINSRCHPITGGVVKSLRQSAVALGRGTAGRLGAIALTVVRSAFLKPTTDQNEVKLNSQVLHSQ